MCIDVDGSDLPSSDVPETFTLEMLSVAYQK